MVLSDKSARNLRTALSNLSTELVSDPGEMLTILSESKDNGTAVGIQSAALGKEIFVTAVDDIIINEDVTVVLKNYDVTGYMLETNKLKLGEIKSVVPFKSPFENPYMKTLKQHNAL